MNIKDLKVKIFADGADSGAMKAEYVKGIVKGFTTNPTLMKKAGVKDYMSFAQELVRAIPDLSLSFEVFADDFATMEREAEMISALGKNVMVKIPITNSKGDSSISLIRRLSQKGINMNVTAVFTIRQVLEVVDAFARGTHNYVSVFAGRIANAGVDPEPIMTVAAMICHKKEGVELLWASPRETLNIIQADRCGCDIITVTNDLLDKLGDWGKSLEQYSLETVQMFARDGKSLGFSILK
mgnify:CR=1 FL=1